MKEYTFDTLPRRYQYSALASAVRDLQKMEDAIGAGRKISPLSLEVSRYLDDLIFWIDDNGDQGMRLRYRNKQSRQGFCPIF